jgi:hypothetical protein
LIGTASHYSPKVGAGSCGAVHENEALVAALPHYLMANNPWPPANCGKNVKVTRADGTGSVTVQVVDTCGECLNAGYEDVVIDLSEGAFKVLDSDLGKGRIPIS